MKTEPFKVYNTFSRKIELLRPLKPGEVSIYTCGPTVYNFQHIGNYRCYIFEDVLVKALRYFDYQVHRVMNITDVGHLTSDEDEGEDKLEVGAKREGTTAWEVAKKYEAAFLADLEKLQIERPNPLVRATETIEAQIALIQTLEQKGYTYQTNDGIYFDSSKVADYGALARLDIKGLQAGIRVEMSEKKNPTDFALWKFSPKTQKRDMEWESPWGIGFPGWHIECSAICLQNFGSSLDIHCGGIDHVAVHHTNEIAQSEAATGQPFVKYWLHSGHLLVDDEKMAKSLGNVFTLADLVERGFDPLSLRLFSYSAHYRSKQNFTWEGLTAAQTSLKRLRAIVAELLDPVTEEAAANISLETQTEDQSGFAAALADDLNLPAAMAEVWTVLRSAISQPRKLCFIRAVDQVLSLDLFRQEISVENPKEIEELAKSRQQARENRDWEKSDQLRRQIEELGYIIKDEKSGYVLTKRTN